MDPSRDQPIPFVRVATVSVSLTEIHKRDRQKRRKKRNQSEHYSSDRRRVPSHFAILYGSDGIGNHNGISEERLLHYGLCRDYFFHRRFEMLPANSLIYVRPRFGGSG